LDEWNDVKKWNNGTLEYWVKKEMIFPLFHHSYIPPFQVKIIPLFYFGVKSIWRLEK
jgi:hypothetical protein